MQLSKVIFWDINYEQIDWDISARFVIERVLVYGTLLDWKQIQEYYGMSRIRDEMLKSRNLDARALSFLSCIFKIPQSEFRCYMQIQSSQGHWSY